jgi:diguanylate cyclase (GGDEF)-like protein
MIRTQNAEIQHTNKKLEGAMAELNRMVTRDELTGLSNRRHFLEVINEHIARSRNERFGFGLCVLDVDNFKQINDTFGHLVGDKVLRAAADLMRQNMREYDFLARFGGEEFTLIITRGDEPTTRRCAERLRRAIADAELSDLEENVELTVSIGATMFQRGDTLEAALARADAAMYEAKQAGRNAFVMKLAVDLPASN